MIPEDVKTELAPCPFCGGEAEQPTPDAPHGGMVQCSSCGASAFGPKWNRRAILTDREARSGWRDIASAPKDRTVILLWSDGWRHPVMGYWSPTINSWLEYASRDTKANIATHWMPLPASPSPSREETEGEKEALAAEGRS